MKSHLVVPARLTGLPLLCLAHLLLACSAPAATMTLISSNSVWRYLVTPTDPGTTWRAREFNDLSWPSGPAQLGFGDGDESTVLPGMSGMTNGIVTAYFRKSFVMTNANAMTNLDLRLLRDDGAVVYLNGIEVRRDNMPAGVIDHYTVATVAVGGADESTFFSTTISPSMLVSGTNVVAVEVHQNAVMSTDLSFALQLIAQTSATTNLPPVTNFPPVVRLVSPTNGAVFTAPTNLVLAAIAYDPGTNGLVLWLEFYTGTNRLGIVTNMYSGVLGTNFFFEWMNAPTGTHVLTVKARDHQGAVSTSPPVTIRIMPAGPTLLLGYLRWEVYSGVPGMTVADLTNHPSFPAHPSFSNLLSSFETPEQVDDNFGARISGFLLPPVTGDYVFYLSSDDQGALFLSSDETPANKVQIAWEPTWSPVCQWVGTGFGRTNNENISQPIRLEAGRRYYIEALHKEGGGGDHLGVAWQMPGELPPEVGAPPIPGAYLATFGEAPTNQPPTEVNLDSVDLQAAETAMGVLSNTAYFRITRSDRTNVALTVYCSITGTASNGLDYVALPNMFVIPVGSRSLTVPLRPLDDQLAEGTETVVVALQTPSCLGIIPRPADCYRVGPTNLITLFIADDETPFNYPPNVAITWPTNGASFISPTNLAIVASASDPNDLITPGLVTQVEFFDGTNRLAVIPYSSIVPSNGVIIPLPPKQLPFVFNWTNPPPGSHALRAMATDNGGLRATSALVTVTVQPATTTSPPLLPAQPMSYASFVVGANGILYGWGDNYGGRLGYPTDINELTFTPRPTPPPPGVPGWKSVTAGYWHTLALAQDGQIYSCGDNTEGQLGVGDTLGRHEWTLVPLPAGASGWLAVAAGGYHSLAISTEGQLYEWGGGKFPRQTSPALITAPAGVTRWLALAAGQNHSLALADNGELYGWGDDEAGQLGNGAGFQGFTMQLVKSLRPAGVSRWQMVAAGGSHILAIGDDRRLYAWGGNWYGQLGSNTPANADSPVLVPAPAGVTGWSALSAGEGHSLALAADGRLFAWGANYTGQVGIGSTNPVIVTSPTLVSLPAGSARWQAIGAGHWHSLAIGDDCQLYAWGSNGAGQLGYENGGFAPAPQQVSGLGILCDPTAVPQPVITRQPTNQTRSVGQTAVFSLIATGAPPLRFQWHFNNLTLLGATNSALIISNVQPGRAGSYRAVVANSFGSVTSAVATLTVTAAGESSVIAWGGGLRGETNVPPGLNEVILVAAGGYHSLALRADGSIVGWGAGSNCNPLIAPDVCYGQSIVPPIATNVAAIGAGWYHSLVLKRDGTLFAWGAGTSSTGTFPHFGQAIVPSGLSNVAAIAVGGGHNLALKSDGSVVAWGYNNDEQASVPPGLSNVIAMAAGGYHNLALKSDGTVVGWGWNAVGQISLPAALADVIDIAAGNAHSLALRSDGTVVSWGYQTNVPFGLSNVVAIAAGNDYSLALKRDGAVVGWGFNQFGQSVPPAGLSNTVAISAKDHHSLAVTGLMPPRILAQPLNRTVVEGGKVIFKVASSGSLPLTYQWRFNGVSIPGATNALLRLSGVLPGSTGAYSVVASNRFGVATSQAATLTVITSGLNLPRITAFSPRTAPTGTLVAIVGINFAATPALNTVYFGAVKASVIGGSANTLSVIVPPGATYAPISVTVNGRTGWSRDRFNPTFAGSGPMTASSFVASEEDLATGDGPVHLAAADFDGDGKPDLAVANRFEHTISIYRCVSTPGVIMPQSFAPAFKIATGLNPTELAAADLDGDGRLDLVSVNADANSVSVFRNQASTGSLTAASFPMRVDVATGPQPIALAIGDLDLDGRPDIVTANHGDNSFSALRNISSPGVLGSNSFAMRRNFGTGAGAHSIALGDLNSDGRLDAVVGNFDAGTVSVLPNQASPGDPLAGFTFGMRADFPAGGRTVAIGDVDGDGAADIVSGSWSGNTISLLRKNPAISTTVITSNSFLPAVTLNSGGFTHNVALGDLDGDGKPDLVAVTEMPSQLLLYHNGSSAGSLTASNLSPRVDLATGWNAVGVVLADFDLDGKLDVAFANHYDDSVRVYRNETAPTNQQSAVLALVNIDCGANLGASAKQGFAAIGQTTNDHWNYYTRDADDSHFNWRTFGVLSNMLCADKVPTGVILSVSNAPGAWGIDVTDPMYHDYLYPFDGGSITLTVDRLPPGDYQFLLYGHGPADNANSDYELFADGVSLGHRATRLGPGWNSPVWQEGTQFVAFRDVRISSANQHIKIVVHPGADGYAVLAGLQIAATRLDPAWSVVDLGEALDATNLVWRTSDPTLWQGQREISFDGQDAARGHTADCPTGTWLETTVIGPGTVSFRWKFINKGNEGQMFFTRLAAGGEDGVNYVGEEGWTQHTFALLPGTNLLRWTVRGPCDEDGEIAWGYIDQVIVTPGSLFVRQLIPSSRSQISINCTPATTVSVYAVEDQPPAGWLAAAISDGGVFDARTGRVKFGPFFDHQARTLTYQITPPGGFTGIAWFTGLASADGVNFPITGADRIVIPWPHPADNAPVNWSLAISEVTAYASAWRRSQTWPSGPNPIPMDYVTRAASLWRAGECYRMDAAITNAPLWWVSCHGSNSLAPASAPLGAASSITRQLPSVFTPPASLPVSLAVTPDSGVGAFAIEEHLPPGWIAGNISGGGEFDVASGTVRWGPFFGSAPQNLAYEATPLADAPASAAFTGAASFDGVSLATTGASLAHAIGRLEFARSSAGCAGCLRLSGLPGQRFVIEASIDLQTWVPLSVVTIGDGTMEFTDPAAGGFSQRFYRAKPAP